jgi:hypothetical protein
VPCNANFGGRGEAMHRHGGGTASSVQVGTLIAKRSLRFWLLLLGTVGPVLQKWMGPVPRLHEWVQSRDPVVDRALACAKRRFSGVAGGGGSGF